MLVVAVGVLIADRADLQLHCYVEDSRRRRELRREVAPVLRSGEFPQLWGWSCGTATTLPSDP